MPLTDLAVRNAKPADQLVKFSDGGGLQLWVFPDGAKRWRLAYRAGGSQKLLAIGVYPEVGLKDAREAREAAKKILADGGDPLAVKKHAKAELAIASTNTFEAVAGRTDREEAQRRQGGPNHFQIRMAVEPRHTQKSGRGQSRKSRRSTFCACFA